MDHKIQELTEQLYREGVQKGEEKAKVLIEDADRKAGTIIEEARVRSGKIIADAEAQAADIRHAAEGEIRLAGMQVVSLVKQQIVDAVIARSLDTPLSKTLSDPTVLRELVLSMAQHWKSEPIEAVLPASLENQLGPLLKEAVARELRKGLQVSFSKNIKAGFRIGPAGQGFKISMTDDDFAVFFREFLRPRTQTLLFGENNA
jgi:V/A-type H+-transporting ATPase subunit E